MPFCVQCGMKVTESARFCSRCGTKLAPPAVDMNVEIPAANSDTVTPGTGLSFPMNFTITREKQFVCSATFYKVIVNGVDLGNIGVGKTKITTIDSENVSVEIRCTSIMMTGIHATFQLRVTSDTPGVTFKLKTGGPIDAQVHGAQIITFNGKHDGRYF